MAKTATKKPAKVTKPPRRYVLQGLVRYTCPKHGWATDSLPGATVWCHCGKKLKADN